MAFAVRSHFRNKKIVSLADSCKVAAGNYNRTVVDNADSPSDAVMHLMYYTLK